MGLPSTTFIPAIPSGTSPTNVKLKGGANNANVTGPDVSYNSADGDINGYYPHPFASASGLSTVGSASSVSSSWGWDSIEISGSGVGDGAKFSFDTAPTEDGYGTGTYTLQSHLRDDNVASGISVAITNVSDSATIGTEDITTGTTDQTTISSSGFTLGSDDEGDTVEVKLTNDDDSNEVEINTLTLVPDVYPQISIDATDGNGELISRTTGGIKVWDDLDNGSREDGDGNVQWERVTSPRHDFFGSPVIGNGLIRLRNIDEPGTDSYYWDGSSWAADASGVSEPVSGASVNTVDQFLFDELTPERVSVERRVTDDTDVRNVGNWILTRGGLMFKYVDGDTDEASILFSHNDYADRDVHPGFVTEEINYQLEKE